MDILHSLFYRFLWQQEANKDLHDKEEDDKEDADETKIRTQDKPTIIKKGKKYKSHPLTKYQLSKIIC